MSEQVETASGVRPRPGGRTARVRDQVLRATVEVVAQHGVENLQYEEVARVAAVNRATLHRNWPDRDELVRAAITRYAEDSVPLHDSGDLVADLTDFLCALAEVGRSPIGRALMRAAMYSGENAAIRELGLRVLDQRLPVLQARLDRAAEAGDLPPVDATFFNEVLSGPVHLHVTRAREPFGRDYARRIVDLVLAGVRSVAAASPPDAGTPSSG